MYLNFMDVANVFFIFCTWVIFPNTVYIARGSFDCISGVYVFAVPKSYVVDGESRGHANGMGWKVENGKQ